MSEYSKANERWWTTLLLRRTTYLSQREGQAITVLALVIGVLTGLAVVAFILVTERLGMRLYPVGSAAWRRVLIPVLGSLGAGYLLAQYFPRGRANGLPHTKAPLFAPHAVIPVRT